MFRPIIYRVIDAFVDGQRTAELGFERAEAAETGRPGYDPRDLLKLCLYGYLHQLRSSRRSEAECRRNVELMWLLGRLYPDHKSVSKFRRVHRDAVAAAGAQLVRFARDCGLVKGEWVAIDGTKFRAVSGAGRVRKRQALERYLDSCEKADEEQQAEIDPAAVQAALDKLKQDPEPEARMMRSSGGGFAPAYNVQTAVDAEHALIVTHAVVLDAGDNGQLEPMATAAQKALGVRQMNVVADGCYANAGQSALCEQHGIVPHAPVKRAVNNQVDGNFFPLSAFRYQTVTDTYLYPAGKAVRRKQLSKKDRAVYYRADADDCGGCALKSRCTQTAARMPTRLIDQDALNRMHARATPDAMKLQRSTVEHPFAALKYRIFGHPRLLLRGAHTEISLASMAYSLGRMVNILGAGKLSHMLRVA